MILYCYYLMVKSAIVENKPRLAEAFFKMTISGQKKSPRCDVRNKPRNNCSYHRMEVCKPVSWLGRAFLIVLLQLIHAHIQLIKARHKG